MDTIFALSTSVGKSGVAVIRISGPNASESLKYLGYQKPLEDRKAQYAILKDYRTDEVIDHGLILYFKGPHSFTGEDVAELQIHGSRAVILSILELLASIKSFRMAEPGEFTMRAFSNGKLDLTQAEAIADLIDAETRMQQRQAIRQMSGSLEKLYNNWRQQLINNMALIEAFIDFPDEDLPSDLVIQLEHEVALLRSELQLHLNDNRRGEKLRNGLYITILGAPNAGKSSLLNLLAKRDVVIVSNIAGTTRDIIEINLDILGCPVVIADTAGLRTSLNEIENEGIKRAKHRASISDYKIVVFDSSLLPELDQESLDLVDQQTLVIFNKIDLLDTLPDISLIPNIGAEQILLSVEQELGLKGLILFLETIVQKEFLSTSDPVLTRIRHRKHLEDCLSRLDYFNLQKSIELAAEDLRSAATSLGKIVGTIDLEEVLDEIFHRFCIGK